MGKVTLSKRTEFGGSGISVSDLEDFLEGVPESGLVRITHVPGDRPMDASSTRIEVTWDA